MKNILSLDGGGVKGILQSSLLSNINNKFDLIAGTSTGALVAACLGTGFTSSQITDFYLQEAKNIFKKDILSKTNVTELLYSKYPNNNRRNSFQKILGNRLFGECTTKVMICAYDAYNYKPKFFKSWREDDAKLKIVDLCMYSSSAPIYFAPIPPGFIDGGIQANCPSLPAYAEGLVLWRQETLNLLSIGCGSVTTGHVIETNDENSRSWGLNKWLTKIVDLLIDSPLQAEEYILNQLLMSTPDNYIRIQPSLDKIGSYMDNFSDTYLNSCINVAKSWTNDNQNTITEINSWNK